MSIPPTSSFTFNGFESSFAFGSAKLKLASVPEHEPVPSTFRPLSPRTSARLSAAKQEVDYVCMRIEEEQEKVSALEQLTKDFKGALLTSKAENKELKRLTSDLDKNNKHLTLSLEAAQATITELKGLDCENETDVAHHKQVANSSEMVYNRLQLDYDILQQKSYRLQSDNEQLAAAVEELQAQVVHLSKPARLEFSETHTSINQSPTLPTTAPRPALLLSEIQTVAETAPVAPALPVPTTSYTTDGTQTHEIEVTTSETQTDEVKVTDSSTQTTEISPVPVPTPAAAPALAPALAISPILPLILALIFISFFFSNVRDFLTQPGAFGLGSLKTDSSFTRWYASMGDRSLNWAGSFSIYS